ncbi:MAG: hypothetical protein K2H23_06005 [Oscillospiraceae bacterium]|nr:hypothetical protein [Oscillospiraceae bacterium]
MNKDFDELFDGDFSDDEKAAAAKMVMSVQDKVRFSGVINIALSVLFCAAYFAIVIFAIINFEEVVDNNMDPKAVHTSARHLKGEAGVAQDIIAIIFAPFAICLPVTAAVSAEKDNKLYREFTARKLVVSNVTENESVKGLYTVTANYNGGTICFDTTDSAAKDYTMGSTMIVVDFSAVKAGTYEKNYEYYTAETEQRRRMTLEKVSNRKYIIIHI